MKSVLCILLVICGGLVDIANGDLKILDGNDPGQCDKIKHGEEVLVKDREDNEKILICSHDNGVYQWRTVDGSTPPGELFNPAYDCSDILDKDSEAKDGFYWVQFDSYTPKKVWCDMTTDGGGFMLIGHKNHSITWDVPSNDNPVEPFGDPHWSSSQGDAPILDFRVQMSTAYDFEQTKAHWSFRLNKKRPLKNLLIMGEKGCDRDSPGIGDIAYVKDLQTEEIVTTKFRCSKFGIAHIKTSKIGWSMMNFCLQTPCSQGFAYHHVYPIQLDYSGAFSYSVTGQVSGIVHSATALIGCNDYRTCCGCYGPVGGKQDYCSRDCQSLNGGTVVTNVYTWFWMRSALPKKVWNKCMEYKVTNGNGDIVWYKLVGGNVNPKKGRCAKNQALLNEIVVVPDSDIAEKVPAIPGLIEYRKDSKELYVRSNKTWNVIAQEKKVLQEASEMVKPILDELEKKLDDQDQEIAQLEKQLERVNQTLKHNGDKLVKKLDDQNQQMTNRSDNMFAKLKEQLEKVNYTLQDQLDAGLLVREKLWSRTRLNQVYYDISGWVLVARFSNNDPKNWMASDGNWWYDRLSPSGATTNPSDNNDMISEAFWKATGNRIKITRSDDPSHTALLSTTSNCLQGKTFRSHITGYGNFRNGAVWASNMCLGNCPVSYGGQYQSTSGFEKHSCSSDIQSSNNIGFWCDWSTGDGAVMMIGGGGNNCGRADHGIGITEENAARFGGGNSHLDFGRDPAASQTSYSLNLWVG